MPKVVICVVPGWAAGGGHSLHVVSDLTLASAEHARFKQTDADVGSFDGGFGSAYLARQVGPEVRPRDLLPRRGVHRRPTRTPWAWSTASSPMPSWRRTALDWGRRIVAKSPTAQRMLKYSFNLIDDGLVGQQLFAGETTRLAYMAEEAVEGRDAFLEKRDPDFSRFPVARLRAFRPKAPEEEDAVIVEVMGGADEHPEARVVDVDDLGRLHLALGEVTDEEAARGAANAPGSAGSRTPTPPFLDAAALRAAAEPRATAPDWADRWDAMVARAARARAGSSDDGAEHPGARGERRRSLIGRPAAVPVRKTLDCDWMPFGHCGRLHSTSQDVAVRMTTCHGITVMTGTPGGR